MKAGWALALCLLAAAPAVGQEAVSSGTGAALRVLDKLNGVVDNLNLANGQSAQFGRISVVLRECRYPEGNASGDAYAFVTVNEIGKDAPVFSGWIIASSPAIHPMDHARYDVWVLGCTTS